MLPARANRSVLLALEPPVLGELMALLLTRPGLSIVIRTPDATEAVVDLTGRAAHFDVVVTRGATPVGVIANAVVVLTEPSVDGLVVRISDAEGTHRHRLGDVVDLLPIIDRLTTTSS